MSDSYTPISIVESCHDIAHLNNKLQEVDSSFSLSYDDYWNSYTKSLLTIPAIISAIGIVYLLLLNAFLFFRICCRSCCRAMCRPRRENFTETSNFIERREVKESRFSIFCLSFTFYVAAFCVIASDQGLFAGNKYLTQGVNVADDALNYLSNTFTTLTNKGDQLQQDGVYLEGNTTASSCVFAVQLQPYIDQYNTDVAQYLDFVQPVSGYLGDANDYISRWGSKYKNYSIWVLYAIVLIVVTGYLLGLWMQSKLMLQINIAFAQLIIAALLFLCFVEMVLVMGLADFCMSPTTNVLQLVSAGTDYDMVYYYTTCNGTAPTSIYIDEATVAINELQTQLATLQTVCPLDEYIDNMVLLVPSMQAALATVVNATACPPIQAQALDVLETGICYDSFIGLYIVWVSQYFSTFFLMAVTLIVAITYYSFGQYWDMNRQLEEDTQILGAPTFVYFDSSEDGSTVRGAQSVGGQPGLKARGDSLYLNTATRNSNSVDDRA